MSVNKVILVGRLGAEPESRAFPNGGSICNLRLATSESWKDKQTGERKERTEWHRVTLNNRLGEIAQQYLQNAPKRNSSAPQKGYAPQPASPSAGPDYGSPQGGADYLDDDIPF